MKKLPSVGVVACKLVFKYSSGDVAILLRILAPKPAKIGAMKMFIPKFDWKFVLRDS